MSQEHTNSGYTSIVAENLKVQNMVKNHRFAKSINYASWNRFIQMLSYKAESAGMKVIEADPKNTTKTCNNCGNTQSMPISKKIYYCEVCDLTEDRDINASINILHRATTLGQRGSHTQGDMASAVQQASKSRIEELRTDKTHPFLDAVIA
jgi:putative transposase